MKVPFVDLPAQHRPLREELRAAFEQVMDSCAFINGENVQNFEDEIAGLCGVKYGVGLNSGTDALVIALRAFGVGKGDEVITSAFTFGATAESILLAGATPVFADIDPISFNLDPKLAADKISPKTKAIMPVHLFGQVADMRAFAEIATHANIRLVADAAQAIGATYHGQAMGKLADVSTLSFYPTKNLGACGDGGMAVTDNEEAADRMKLLRVHGGTPGQYGYYEDVGYTSRLDALQAAFLRVKTRKLAEWNEARRRNAAHYHEMLGHLREEVVLPADAESGGHIYHQYTIRVRDGRRDSLQRHLIGNGVSAMVYYPLALHLQKPYSSLNYHSNDLPGSEQATQEVLSIPVHPELSLEQLTYTAEQICAFFAG